MGKDQGKLDKAMDMQKPQDGYKTSPNMPKDAFGFEFKARVLEPNLKSGPEFNSASEGVAETDGVLKKGFES